MKFLLALVASVVFSSSAVAEAPTPESVANLLTAIHAEKVVDVLFQNIESMMRKSMSQALQGKASTEQNKKFFDSYMPKIMLIMRDELSWERMKPLYVQVYSETFSQEEIDGLIRFYDSDVGRSYVSKLPVVMEKTMAISQQQMQPMMQRLQDALQQAIAESQAGARYDGASGRFK